MRWIGVFAAVGIACSGEPNDEPVGDDPVDPDPWVYDDGEDHTPQLSLAQVSTGITEAFDVFRDMDPSVLLDAYDEMIESEDAACPYYYDSYYPTYGYYYWRDNCITGAGAAFDGYMAGVTRWDWTDSNYHWIRDGWFSGDWSIQRPDGSSLALNGYYNGRRYERLDGTWTYFSLSFSGDVRWEGPAYAGTWIDRAPSAYLTASGGYQPSTGAVYANFQGGFSGYDGISNAVFFDSVYYNTASRCSLEPSGFISLRDDAGEWYAAEFDGPTYWGGEAFPTACDGCGRVYYRGELMGEVCPDFSPITSWEVSPW